MTPLQRSAGLATWLLALPCMAQPHVGNSPSGPPQANDITFVVDQDVGLDTGCRFRGGGPLVFSIKTTRYVGEVNPDGTLRNPAQLVANGVLAPTATLTMPGFDVDYDAMPPLPAQPERDKVFFNGRAIGFLRGLDNTWITNSFDIPIEQVRFPARGAPGSAPEPAENTIRIDIDTANADEVWCTEVDWATLGIKALSPVVLVHGNNSNGGFFDRQGFTATLRTRGIPFDNSITMRTDTVARNAVQLNDALPGIATSFGVDSLHIVAHSKGGLDMRAYLGHFQPAHDAAFKVLSLTTLGTPHNGSVLADVLLDYDAAARVSSFVRFKGFPGFTGTLARLTSVDAGKPSLSSAAAAAFNAANVRHLPAGTVYNTVAADADSNTNGMIDFTPDEYRELRVEDRPLAAAHAANADLARGVVDTTYQVLRRTARVTVTLTPVTIRGRRVATVATLASIPNPVALGNDTLVTIPSGQGIGTLAPRVRNTAVLTRGGARNHSSIANRGVATLVLPWLFNTERAIGDLR